VALATRTIFEGRFQLKEYRMVDEHGDDYLRYVLDLYSPGQKKGIVEVMELYPADYPPELKNNCLKNAFAEMTDRAIANSMFSGFVPKGKCNDDGTKTTV